MFGSLASAQTGMRCSKETHYTRFHHADAKAHPDVIFAEPYDVCKFSDGTVHTTLMVGDDATSLWFTLAQWRVEQAKQRLIEKQLAQEEMTCRLYIDEGKKPPHDLNCQRPLMDNAALPGPPLKDSN